MRFAVNFITLGFGVASLYKEVGILVISNIFTKLSHSFIFGNKNMALIKSVNGKSPQIGKGVYLSENATIVGDVLIGDHCSLWFNAVLRGDVHYIKIGDKVNIQDGAVIHCTYQKHPTEVGNNVSIGHNALVHGCTIHDNVLIGMGAIVMDGVVVESNSIVAAGAVVLEGSRIESGSIYAGVPAKKVKSLSQEQTASLIEGIADKYVMYSSWFSE
jgi:carbonic anhydrase/acetyltransferase-like protein (isoleucine patch superfamily)